MGNTNGRGGKRKNNMGKVEELRARLENLQKKRQEDTEIKKLQKQIKGEEFAQTTGGKVFNKIGDFGQGLGKVVGNVGKKITTPPKDAPKKAKPKTLQQVMDEMPQ